MAIIKINPLDELASVIDKTVTQEEETVYLDMPEDAYIAQNILNFKLLKREAESVGKEIVLVTNDSRVKALAKKAELRTIDSKKHAGTHAAVEADDSPSKVPVTDIMPPQGVLHAARQAVPITKDVKKAQKSEEKSTAEERITEKEIDLAARKFAPAPSFAKDTAGRQKVSPRRRKNLNLSGLSKFIARTGKTFASLFIVAKKQKRATLTVVAGSVVLGSLGFLLFGVLPSAAITLFPKTIQDTISMQLVADANISSAQLPRGVIPAQILQERRENTFTFNATGEAQIETRAEGVIKVFNEYSSDPQTLVATTRFVSSDGKTFKTKETIVIPGTKVSEGKIIPGSTTVEVAADETGEEYNIGPTSFSIPGFGVNTPKYRAFYGKSSSAMEGGFSGKRTVVTQKDIDEAKQKLEDEFLAETEQLLRDRVPDTLTLLEDSIDTKFDVLEIDAQAQDPKDKFTIRAVAISQALLINQDDVLDAAKYRFLNSSEYNADYELTDKRDIRYLIKEINFERGYGEMTTEIEQLFARRINIEDIYKEVAGKGEIEVRKVLSQKEELEKSQVRFWPIWVKTVPNNLEKIEIKVEIE